MIDDQYIIPPSLQGQTTTTTTMSTWRLVQVVQSQEHPRSRGHEREEARGPKWSLRGEEGCRSQTWSLLDCTCDFFACYMCFYDYSSCIESSIFNVMIDSLFILIVLWTDILSFKHSIFFVSTQSLKDKIQRYETIARIWELSLEDITRWYSKCCFAMNCNRGQHLKSLQWLFIVWHRNWDCMHFLWCFALYFSNRWDYLPLFPISCIVIIVFVKQMGLFAIIWCLIGRSLLQPGRIIVN